MIRLRVAPVLYVLVVGGMAAQQPPTPPHAGEVMTVTGTRLEGPGASTTAAIVVYTRDDISASGATSIGDFLAWMPSIAGRGTSAATNVNGRGTSNVNLRGLDAARTLILINGRRTVETNNLGASLAVDLNNIPVALVEHVDILTGGASSVYGSDAVAGVINVVLREHFDGTEASLQTGAATAGDGGTTTANVTWGKRYAAGDLMTSVGYLDRKNVYAGDRDLFKSFLLETGNPPIIVPGGSGNTGAPREDSLIIPGQGMAARTFTIADAYNTAPLAYLQTPQNRLTLNLIGGYDAAGRIRAFSEISYVARRSNEYLGAFPLVVGPDQLGGALRELLRNNRNNTFSNASTFGTFQRRFVEAGPRNFDQTVNTVRAVFGMKGDFGPEKDAWHWETSYVYGDSTVEESISNRPQLGKLAQALDPSQCSTAVSPPPDVAPCVNLFYPGSLRPVDINWIMYTDHSKFSARQLVLTGFVTRDFSSGTRPAMQVAAGGEIRRETARDDPDPITVAGLSAGSQRDPTRGGYTVREIFGELRELLLRDRPLARALTVEAGARYSRLTAGADTSALSYRSGIDWRPSDGISLRVAYATAFRSPNVNELFLGKGRSYPAVADPCGNLTLASDATLRANCAAQGVPLGMIPAFSFETPAAIGGNQELKPESARTKSAGLDLVLPAMTGVRFSVDWFDISINNPIGATDVGTIYDECYQRSNPEFCRFVSRDPLNGQLIEVLTPYVNQSFIRTSGLDVSVLERLKVSRQTALNVNFAATYLSSFGVKALPSSSIRSRVGYLEPAGGGYPRWRGRFGIESQTTAAHGTWRAGWTVRYIDALRSWRLRDAPGAPSAVPTVSPYSYHDLSLAYEMTRVTVIGGVTNVFDKQAPYYTGAPDTNTDVETYDTVGRRVFVSLRYRF